MTKRYHNPLQINIKSHTIKEAIDLLKSFDNKELVSHSFSTKRGLVNMYYKDAERLGWESITIYSSKTKIIY